MRRLSTMETALDEVIAQQIRTARDFQVATVDRNFDIRIEVQGTSIKCYLDGTLVSQATDTSPTGDAVYAAASRDLTNGDVIIKAVNVTAGPEPMVVR